jgi:outer membrane receptor protein involved in Fe transport
MKNIQNLKCLILLLAIFPLLILSASAQQTVSGASLSGRVEDAAGASVPAATVVAKHLGTNQIHNVVADGDGRFRFSYLPVGDYEVSCAQTGFAPMIHKFTAGVGQALEMVLQLNVADVAAEVSVSSDNTLIVETARTQVAETIMPRDVENLPLNGRNYLDLALLLPGVSRTNTGSVQRFAETSAVPGTGISVAGQRNLNNSFIVDGSSANDDAADLAGSFYSQEVIREFQVVSSGAVAEFGRATSGFINIITQSGTNNLRGKVYGFLRDSKFDARNPISISPEKDPLTQTQYGASLGGRIIPNRTFFFTNFEQTRRNDTSIITISPANVTAINNRLNQIGFRGPRIETGLVSGGYDATNLFGRVDHNLTSKNQFFVTYNFYDISAVNARTVGGLNAISRGTNLKNRDHTINGSLISTLGARSLNEFRLQYRKSKLAAPANDPVGPAVNIAGIASFGIATFSPLARDIDLFQISDAFSTTRGDHSLKFGGEFTHNRVDIFFPGAFEGVYTFTNLNNFLNSNYSQFQQAFGATSQLQKNPNVALFAQDEWKPRKDLTLNLGLRYDVQFLPDPIKTDTNNFGPRFGLAYAPGDRKTVFRASFGLFYERIPLRATSNALQRDGSKYIVAQLAPTAVGAPTFPNILSAAPSVLTTKPNVTRIDPEIEAARSQQANVQIERELPFNASVSVGYLYLRGMNLLMSRNANVPRPVGCTGPNLCRPDPNFGNISRFESSGDSYYNGLVVSFNKRQSDWASVRLSYTYSKAIDNAGNFFFSTPQNNFDLRDDRGLSDNDQRHRLTLSGTFNTPRFENSSARTLLSGFQLSYIFSYASHLPFNPLTGNDRNGDTNFNDRPINYGRNTGRGFDSATLDLRVSRRFSFTEKTNLEVLVEGFNVLNRANYSVPNNVFGTGATPLASFGRPTAAQDPRHIQLGFRFNF